MAIRVFELAKELGTTGQRLVTRINELELEFRVDNPATKLTKSEEAAVRRAFGDDSHPLIGVWRHSETVRRGNRITASPRHLIITADSYRYVETRTYYADAPDPRRPYDLEWLDEFSEARISVAHPHSGQFRGIVRLEDERLQIRWGGVFGQYPQSFHDETGSLDRYVVEDDLDLATEVAKPPKFETRPTLTHPSLGAFHWDANLSWWSMRRPFGGAEDVSLHVDGEADWTATNLISASVVFERLDIDGIASHAARELLELHNDSWRQDDSTIDAAQFAARLGVVSVGVRSDGAVTVYYDDGDLFYGHTVFVYLDDQLRPQDAGIAG